MRFFRLVTDLSWNSSSPSLLSSASLDGHVRVSDVRDDCNVKNCVNLESSVAVQKVGGRGISIF